MLSDSRFCSNPMENVDIFLLAGNQPSLFQATSSDKHVVGCGLNGSSIFKVSAVLLEVFLHGASQWTAWNLGGGLSRRSILKVFSMRFRIRSMLAHLWSKPRSS